METIHTVFTVSNFAKIGELEDAYSLYEQSLSLYENAIQEYKKSHPRGGIPDLNEICRKEFKKLIDNYYNSHVYLFTKEYKTIFSNREMLFILSPVYFTSSSKQSFSLILHKKTFKSFLSELATAALVKLRKRKEHDGIIFSLEEERHAICGNIVGMLDSIEQTVKEMQSVDYIHSNQQTELYVYRTLNSVSCRVNGHNVVPSKQLVYSARYPEKMVCLPIHICKDCHKAFIGEQTYLVFTKEYGNLSIQPKKDSSIEGAAYCCWNQESALHRMGYNVRDGEMSDSDRQALLKYLLESKKISYLEATNTIENAIRQFSERPEYDLAIKKWTSDLVFLGNYIKQ